MRLSKYVLIFLPIIELILFIEVGAFMGSLNVILSIIISMFLGYYLIKQKLRGYAAMIAMVGLEKFKNKTISQIYMLNILQVCTLF